MDPQPEPTEQIFQLLFSGGAGAVGYQLGFAQGLMEIVGKEKLKKYKLGGVSAGTAVAGFFYTSLHTDTDIKYWYMKHMRTFFGKENRKYFGLVTNGEVIKEIARKTWSFLQENANIPNINGNYHVYVTEVEGFFSFKAKCIDIFQDSEQFADAIHASCMIPMITAFGLFSTHKGIRCVDGGVKKPIPFKYENSQQIFINVLPNFTRKWPIVTEQVQNLHFIDIHEVYNLQFPNDYWIWDEQWSDQMFLQGTIAAMQLKDQILELFKED